MNKLKLRTRSCVNIDYGEKHIRDYDFQLLDEKGKVIGTAYGTLVAYPFDAESEDIEYVTPDELIQIADDLSSDFYDATQGLFQLPTGALDDCESYFYLDRLEVKKNKRCKGYGSQFLQMITKNVKKKADLMYFTIAPLETSKKDIEKWERAKSRLEKFYNHNGFISLSTYASLAANERLTVGVSYPSRIM